MPLETVSDDKERKVADIMTEELTKALYESRRCTIVERENLASVLKEIGFQMTGAVDPNKAVEAGKMLGAQYILVGKITMASLTSNGPWLATILSGNENVGLIGAAGAATFGMLKGKVALVYRIIDVQTGEIKIMGEVEGSEPGNDAYITMHKACKEASKNFLKDMVQNVRSKVIDVSAETFYIDMGSAGGFRKGETLTVIRETTPIEVNGKIVGMKEV